MKIAVIGGGPAGLYFAYLAKRARPDLAVSLYEQNPPDATFGFGVVFSERALSFLREDDPETEAAIAPHLALWDDITLDILGTRIAIDGIGFSAIGRLALLRILQNRARAVGASVRFTMPAPPDLSRYDLVVATDGVNSALRAARPEFGTTTTLLDNRFAWFGVTKEFATLTQSFRRHGDLAFNAHHYRYAAGMSTFIVETDAASFARAGLETMAHEDSRALCERVFADVLDGHALISNRSIWRRFPIIRNRRWHAGKFVLLGDALRTAHFSIGSGTRLALEDAIALARALQSHDWRLDSALPAFEAARRPIVDKLTRAADASAAWYENFASHMALPPWDFALSYITRSGRVPLDRLRTLAPKFVAGYEASR